MDESLYNSPIGLLRISASGAGLTGIHFPTDDDEEERPISKPNSNPHIKSATRELDLYFAQKLKRFETRLDADGSGFQKSVWNALSEIPFGISASYGDIAKRIGNPKSTRAVGLANNRNPISIIVPCHRVIGADGTLIGYGGGIWRKEWLLRHEGLIL